MKTAKINLYSFNELNNEAKQKAISDHLQFLDSLPEHSETDAIESIGINEYLFFYDGSLSHCVTYCGKHPKKGVTEFNFKGEIIIL